MKIGEYVQTEPELADPKAERKRWRVPRGRQDQPMRDRFEAFWNLAIPALLDAYERGLIEVDPEPTLRIDRIGDLEREMNGHYTGFLEELDYLLDSRNDTKPGAIEAWQNGTIDDHTRLHYPEGETES